MLDPSFEPKIIGEEGKEDGCLSRPWGVCALPNGRFAVADRSNNRIQIFSPSGAHLLTFPNSNNSKNKEQEDLYGRDETGNPNKIFNRPAGIAFSYFPFAAIIIADKDYHRIQVYEHSMTHRFYQLF